MHSESTVCYKVGKIRKSVFQLSCLQKLVTRRQTGRNDQRLLHGWSDNYRLLQSF